MEARVGLAGPILGSLGAALCLVPWALTGDEYWQALAFVGFFLNLATLWCVQNNTATTYAIVGSLNKIPLAFVG